MRPTIVSTLLLLLPALAFAQIDSRPYDEVERAERLARAAELKREAGRLQEEADARHKAASAACYKKFLVSGCLEDARKAHTQESRIATRMDLEGTEMERDVKRRDVAAREAQRAIDVPRREAEQKAQGEAYRAEEAQRAEERAAKVADKERQAAENRQKLAEEQAKRQEKLEAQKRKEAKAAEKRKKREAKEAERAARKAEKEAAAAAAPASR
jgi:hypothetical protein